MLFESYRITRIVREALAMRRVVSGALLKLKLCLRSADGWDAQAAGGCKAGQRFARRQAGMAVACVCEPECCVLAARAERTVRQFALAQLI